MAKQLKSECFRIVNRNGQPVLFRTDDVTVNHFTFTITNLTGEPLLLTGGTPDTAIRAGQPAISGASTFSIDFEAMLSTEVVAGLQLTLPDNWNAVYVAGGFPQPPSWSLAPATDITLGLNETLTFLIENIRCADTRPGNFEILYRDIPGYDDRTIPIPKHLDILNVPDPEKKTLPLKEGYINPVHPIRGQSLVDEEQYEEATEAVPVYITYDAGALIENGFTYVLSNTSKEPLVTTDAPDGSEPPVLYMSFVFGEENYAITTQSLGDNNITIDINSQLLWLVTVHTSGTAYWSFFPQNKQVMEGLETIYFPIKKIITALNVSPDTISLLYIQLNNIPGYNDAAYTVQLQKKTAVAEMIRLEADRYTIPYGENVRLSWVSSLAKRVTISYETRDKEIIILDSAKGEIKLNGTDFLLPVPPSAEYTVIRATAYDNSNRSNSKEITVTVNQQQAAILSFTATPILVQPNTATDIALSWQTAHARSLILITPDGPVDVTGKTSATVRVGDAFAFTLEAWSYGSHYPAPTRARQNIYSWKQLNSIGLSLTREVKQVSPAVAYNNPASRVYTMNSVNDSIYNINSSTGNAEQSIPGLTMSLSEDGQRLFSIVRDRGYFAAVTYGTQGGTVKEVFREFLQYEMVHQVLAVGYNVYCTATYVYGADVKNYLVQLPTDRLADAGGFETRLQLNTIRNFPGILCWSGNGSNLYVQTDERTVTTVSLSTFTTGISFRVRSTLGDMVKMRTQPWIFLTSPGTDEMYIYHTLSNELMGVRNIGGGPTSLLLSPDEKTLCIACFRSFQVVLLDTDTRAVTGSIAVGNNPLGMCFSADGKFLFVTNYCSKSVSVIEFSTRQVRLTIPTGDNDGNPYAVAVLNDAIGFKIYVTKESWPQRMSCTNPVKNTTDNISVFAIVKPVNTITEL